MKLVVNLDGNIATNYAWELSLCVIQKLCDEFGVSEFLEGNGA